MTIDASDNAYIVGTTTSTDFPVKGTAIAGSAACFANASGSAFITVVNTTAQTLTYSHCLTGNSGVRSGVRSQLGHRRSGGCNQSCVYHRVDFVSELPGYRQFDSSRRGALSQGVAFVSLLNTATGCAAVFHVSGRHRQRHGLLNRIRFGGHRIRNRAVPVRTDFPDYARGSASGANNNVNGNGEGVYFARSAPMATALADLVYSTYFGGQTVNTMLDDSGTAAQGIVVSGTNAYVGWLYDGSRHADNLGSVSDSPGSRGARRTRSWQNYPLTPTISVSPTILAVWNAADCHAVTAAIRDDHQ